MKQLVVQHLPSVMISSFTALSLIVPFIIRTLNKKLHKLGDPPWKKQRESE